LVIISAIAAEVFRPLHNNGKVEACRYKNFQQKSNPVAGRKLPGSGAEVLLKFRVVDSVKADVVLGVVILSEHCDGVAV
jgi:hypothetical protein